MFDRMRRALKWLGVVLAGAALLSPSVAGAATGPSPSQIRAALRTATHSRQLWATINSCDPHGNGEIGIRGQMPALTFPAHLLMVVTVATFSPSAHRYEPLKGSWKLGGRVFDRGAVVQEGITLKWSGAVRAIAHIRFEWFRDGRLLGTTTRVTRAGHRDDKGSPAGFSAAACSIR